jgi:hypothetical protein
VLVTENDSSEAYSKAFEIILNLDTLYSVTPLSSDKTVISNLDSLVKRAAEATTANFKMGVASLKLPILTTKLTTLDYNVTDNDDGTYSIELANGGFASSNIVVGDYIFGDKDIAIADSEYYNYVGETYSSKVIAKVQSVVTDKKIIVVPVVEGVKVNEALDSQSLIIAKINSKADMVDILRSYPKEFNNMHLVLTFPDKFSKDNKIYAGYYGAAVVQAAMAHLPPQQGLSNMSITVFDRAINSSYFFTESELDEIAEAGISVIAQKSFDTYPYIIRQLTTDTNSLEEMEINKVRCLDYTSIEIKKTVDGYVGKRNVTAQNEDEIYNKIETLLKSIIEDTKNTLLGSVITSYSNLEVLIPIDEPGTIAGSVEVVTPTSLNAIKLGVKSKSI